MFYDERSAKRYFQPKRVTDTFCSQNCDSKSVLAIHIQVSRDIIVFLTGRYYTIQYFKTGRYYTIQFTCLNIQIFF